MWCTNGQHRARNANSSLLAYVVVVMSRCIMFVAGQAGKLWYIQTVPYFDNVTHPNKLAACNTVELVLPWSAKPCASGMLYEAAQPDDATATSLLAQQDKVAICALVDMLRSYHPEKTRSHQNSEVNLDWAASVLGREITWEPAVS